MNDKIGEKEINEIAKSLSPSAKLVIKILENEGKLTTKDIIRISRLPKSTAHYALRNLIEMNIIEVDKTNEDDLVYKLKNFN